MGKIVWVFGATVLAATGARAANRFAIQQLAIRGGIQALAGDAERTSAGTVTVSYWARNGLSGEAYGGRSLQSRCGYWGGGALRYGWVFGEDGSHAFGVGGGVSRWLHGSLGPMTFARAEVFYELRMHEGFSVQLAAGPAWSLTDGRPSDGSEGRSYKAGDGLLSGSAGLGWTF